MELQFLGENDLKENDAIFNYRRKYLPTQQVSISINVLFMHTRCSAHVFQEVTFVSFNLTNLYLVSYNPAKFVSNLVKDIFSAGCLSHSTSFSFGCNWEYSQRSIYIISTASPPRFCTNWWMVFAWFRL